METDARQSAFLVLLHMHLRKSYSNLALDAQLRDSALGSRESAFTSALVYCCLERQLTLDYNLSLYLRQPLKKLRPEVLISLRLGACQLLFFDKIPHSAAVNSSVSLAKGNRCAFASGLVNAVLRNVSKNGLQLPDNTDTSPFALSIRYSCPEWIIRLWENAYGRAHCEALLQAILTKAPLMVRVNTQKTTREALRLRLEQEGVAAEADSLSPFGLRLAQTNIEKLPSFAEGLFFVQDSACQLCTMLLDVHKGETILDVCSAPGGKAFSLAMDTGEKGRVFALDIYPNRLSLIHAGAKRLALSNIEIAVHDACTVFPAKMQADKVLCDVPCSGLGVLRRKPEIRYKNPEELDKLPDLQYRILRSASDAVKQKGLLVYSTCALNPAENEEVCARFLQEDQRFESVPVFPQLPRYAQSTPQLTLMPHLHGCDGFFLAAFRRVD